MNDHSPGTVVITGASAGIGRATALVFARHGWNMALIARGTEGLQRAREEIEEAGGNAFVASEFTTRRSGPPRRSTRQRHLDAKPGRRESPPR